MRYVHDDGGRRAAGFKGDTGDCVTRAIAIATGVPYKTVYDALNATRDGMKQTKRVKRSNARTGVSRPVYERYLRTLGWEWVPTMAIGTGCTVHLDAAELPGGRIICRLSKHLCAVVDGVIHDSFNPNDRGTTIYPPGTPAADIPKGAYWLTNGNGWAYAPLRCVYGYFRKAAPPPMHTITVAALFYDDHVERLGGEVKDADGTTVDVGKEVGRKANRVCILISEAGLAELLSDAEYYSTDVDAYPELIASARRVAAKIRKYRECLK